MLKDLPDDVLRLVGRVAGRHVHQLAQVDLLLLRRHIPSVAWQQLVEGLVEAADDLIVQCDANQSGHDALGHRPDVQGLVGLPAVAVMREFGLPVHAHQDSLNGLPADRARHDFGLNGRLKGFVIDGSAAAYDRSRWVVHRRRAGHDQECDEAERGEAPPHRAHASP
jgi:hypothetical protein